MKYNCHYKGKSVEVEGLNAHHAKTKAAWHFMLPPAQIHLIDVWQTPPELDEEFFENAELNRPGEDLVK
jgi:hypothetical protein